MKEGPIKVVLVYTKEDMQRKQISMVLKAPYLVILKLDLDS